MEGKKSVSYLFQQTRTEKTTIEIGDNQINYTSSGSGEQTIPFKDIKTVSFVKFSPLITEMKINSDLPDEIKISNRSFLEDSRGCEFKNNDFRVFVVALHKTLNDREDISFTSGAWKPNYYLGIVTLISLGIGLPIFLVVMFLSLNSRMRLGGPSIITFILVLVVSIFTLIPFSISMIRKGKTRNYDPKNVPWDYLPV